MKLITREEAANKLGCTRQTISNWVSKGVLTAHKAVINGKACVLIDGDTLDALFDSLEDVKRSREATNKLLKEVKELKEVAEQQWKECVSSKINEMFDFTLLRPILHSFVSRFGGQLNPRDKEIVLSVLDGKTYQWLCEKFDVTPQRIRQIIIKAAFILSKDMPLEEPMEESVPKDESEMDIPIVELDVSQSTALRVSRVFGNEATLRELSKLKSSEAFLKLRKNAYQDVMYQLSKHGYGFAD